MAQYRTTASYQLTDANGQTAEMNVHTYTQDTSTLGDVVTSVNALGALIGAPGVITNAKVTRVGASFLILEAQTTPGSSTPPIDAWFASVADKAQLDFMNSGGARARVSIPAPIEGLFHAPPADLNVNPSYAAMAALIAGLEDYMLDPLLDHINLYRGGTYRGSRRPRRQGRM